MRFHKMIISFFTVFLLLATLGTFSLCVGEELIKGKPILTGEAYQIENLTNDWSDQELWVWTQISKGEIADFNKRYGIVLDPKDLDPEKSEEWEARILTPKFLEKILLHEPFRGALTHHGVRIVGAWFKDPIDLSDATLAHPLWLEGSRFDEDVNLNFLKTPFTISLNGSKFNGKLNMQLIQVESSLAMSIYDTEFEEAKYKAKFIAKFEEVDLRSAKIEGQLIMTGSKFAGKLIMDSLQVGSYLFMNGNTEFTKEVNLLNAKIGNALEMDGSKFTSKLMMQRLEVENDLLMRSAVFAKVTLDGAKIMGNLILSGSTFNSINLTGTNISREFRLSSKNTDNIPDLGAAEWVGVSRLILYNTKVGVLQDSQNSWPENLELEGFTYDRLGKFIKEDGNGTTNRNITWLKDWLKKQTKYSPQPYEHLAKILRQDGRKEEAREILFASKFREHRETTNVLYWVWLGYLLIFFCCGYYIRYTMKWFLGLGLVLLIIFAFTEIKYWVWLNAILIFIGYGYHIYLALFWALGLVIIGTIVLCVSKQYCGKDSNEEDLKYCGLAYSIDMLLPIIHLRKKHYDIDLEGRVRVYFYVHKILGYVLALFIITGLTGIVK